MRGSVAARGGGPTGLTGMQLVHVFTEVNLVIAVLNLVPFPGFDGYEAWKLPGHLLRGSRSRGQTDAGSYGQGLAEKIAERERGPCAEPRSPGSPVARIERDENGQVRIVVDEVGDDAEG